MDKVILASEFDIKKIKIINKVEKLDNGMKYLNIHYDGDRDVYIQTPEFKIPFKGDIFPDKVQITINIDEGTPSKESKRLRKCIEKMDRLVIKEAKKHSQEWLKKKHLSDESLDMFFTKCITRQGTYPYRFKIKSDEKGKVPTIFFDHNNCKTDRPTEVKKHSMVTAIISPKWVNLRAGGQFGVTWVAKQIIIKPGYDEFEYPPFISSDEED